MSKLIDLKGKRFGKLVVIEKYGSLSNQKISWNCLCDCGNQKIIRANNLISGASKSCGCEVGKSAKQRFTKHGYSNKIPLYKVWTSIKQRCGNINNSRYKDYGGRGINICSEWRNNFKEFYDWAMSNGYKDNFSIDRINNDGNYEPNNCRFTDTKTQNNNSRHNHFITINFETKTIAEWCEKYSLTRSCFHNRLNRGWTGENLLIPSLRKNHNLHATDPELGADDTAV